MSSEAFPLSSLQRRLWLAARCGDGFVAGTTIRLRGRLDAAALRSALEGVVDRHEILRTTFEQPAWMKVPQQVVHDEPGLLWESVDARDLDDLGVAVRVEEAETRSVDPGEGPPCAATLIRRAVEEHLLVLALPSLCCDLHGLGELTRELAEEYDRADGERADVDLEPLQYVDFADWQDEKTGEGDDRWRESWARSASGLAPEPEPGGGERLPLEGPAGDRFSGRSLVLPPPEALAGLLSSVAAEHDLAPGDLLMALWSAYLDRLAPGGAVPRARIFDGRRYDELKDGIGLYSRCLPVAAEDDGAASIVERARAAAVAVEETWEWQQLGFPEDAPVPDEGSPYVFAFPFEWHEAEGPFEGGGVAFEPVARRSIAEPFRLKLTACAGPDGELSIELAYDRNRWDRAVAEGVGERFLAFAERALRAPERPFRSLPLLSPAEHRELVDEQDLASRPGAGAALDPAFRFGCLFVRTADGTPDRIAVEDGDGAVSYGALRDRVRRVAANLREAGVGPGARVGLEAERRADTLVGMLAVLEAGGAYVPLEPDLPPERRAAMLADAGAALVLDGDEIVPVSGAGDPGPADDLMYVLFTSGSTGQPKGVAVGHAQVASYLHGVLPRLDLPAGSSFAVVSTLAADLGSTLLFAALATGGRLYLPGREAVTDAGVFGAAMGRRRIDCLKIVPSHLGGLLAAGGGADLLPVRRRVLGGEAAGEELLAAIRAAAPEGLGLLNHYGPTETTVGVTTHDAGAAADAAAPLPLGRPLPAVELYLVDPAGHPVPVGAEGEIQVGGDQVARGYLGRPGETAARFVPHPFTERPGARLYRTGDRARRRVDGVLEFVGRIDDQIKIRGHRIEPAEVAEVLRGHPAVADAVVVPWSGNGTEPRLVAYVVPAGGRKAELRIAPLLDHLRERLPARMIPSLVEVLPSLPLTPNGKVDRAALPEPDSGAYRGAAGAAEMPRGPAEEIVATLFADALGVEGVGRREDFFRLGGHSLLATRVVARARQAFQLEVELGHLFAGPTVEELAQTIEGLRQAGREGLQAPPLRPVGREPDAPLSFAQQRLWFLHRMTPDSPAYNVPSTLELEGAIDAPALALSFTRLVRRHEILRTVYAVRDGEPRQRVLPAEPVPLPVVDLRPLPEAHRRREARRLAAFESSRPFDLERGPVLRVLLVRSGEDAGGPDDPERHLLLTTLHHIASDLGSREILSRELAAQYRAARAGTEEPVAELPVQYGDFAAWQRSWLTGNVLREAVDFWRRELGSDPPPLALPLDRPRPTVQALRGARFPVSFGPEILAGVDAVARRSRTTPFMVLVLLFQTLLSRLTGEDDIRVGTPVAGRGHVDVEELIGFFTNTLVLRSRIDRRRGLEAHLDRIRGSMLEAYAHQHLPFEKLVEELAPERSLARSPLFQVMVTHRSIRSTAMRGGAGRVDTEGVRLSRRRVETGTTRFDLSLDLMETDGGIVGSVEYDTALFDRTTVARWMNALGHLLSAATREPKRPLGRLPVMAAGPRHQILAEWNDTRRGYDGPWLLDEGIRRKALRIPESIALVSGLEAVSYRELERRVTALARRLGELGVGPDTTVAVGLERSVELMVALLATLRAGGAYVPIDPAYPRGRIEGMVGDAAPAAILAGPGVEVPEDGAPVLRLARTGATGRVEPAEAIEPAEPSEVSAGDRDPESLAYVLYTSGSTGRPKGVMCSHRAIVNRLAWMQERFGLTSGDTVLQKTPITFDVSVWELFWPLLQGARLEMVPPAAHRDPWTLRRLAEERRITTIHFVPSMLSAFLGVTEPAACPDLRTVVASGEALPPELARRCGDRLAAPLHNLYGPTEAAVDVSAWECSRAPGGESIPIGRPIANLRLHLADAAGRTVPVGVAGELLIGGVGLARGYLGRPGLTAERFVPDPDSPEPGRRRYRTGDLARWRTDGVLDFLGRIDHQVKVRGVRIELGEIEAVLTEHPAVEGAAVRVVDPGSSEARLAAYVVTAEEGAPTSATLHHHLIRHLAARLPEAMVPALWRTVDALPLTPSGKLDRRALPEPGTVAGDAPASAPRTPLEEVIAEIWREVLGIEEIGVDQSFFALGGHSLLAVRVVSRIESGLGVEVGLRTLFEAPTVARLARAVERTLEEGATPRPELVPMPREERDGPLPLSFAQERLWFLDQLDPGSAAYVVHQTLRVRGSLRLAALAAALRGVVARQESLRTRFTAAGGRPVQEIALSVALPVPVVDLSGLAGEARTAEAMRLARSEARTGFDLSRAPLLRCRIARLSPGEHRVSLTTHHAISDGWSMEVFVREVSELYAARTEGREARLEALPIQYADYAAWQRSWLRGEELERRLAYWRARLDGDETVVLPTDRPRRTATSDRGSSVAWSVPAGLADAVGELARRQGATPFMTLLAAFHVLLSRWAGQERLRVGSPVSGRDRVEVEGLVGFFVNTVVLSADLSDAPNFADFVSRVRSSTLEAHLHSDLPFERLVEELQPERSLSRTPLFQVMFEYNRASSRAEVELPGELDLSPVPLSRGRAKFDLTMAVMATDHGTRGAISYRADLFDRVTVVRLSQAFRRLLAEAVADPQRSVRELGGPSRVERHQLVREWSGSGVDVPAAGCGLHEPIVARAASEPERVALVAGDAHLTYGALEERSRALAAELRRSGVGPESRVGLLMERSIELVIGLLAVLRSGGAYVALDPESPEERLRWQVRDAGVTRVIASAATAGAAEAIGVSVTTPAPTVAAEDFDDAPTPADRLAYVVYTSGSTGRPKGVLGEHGAAVRHLEVLRQRFGFGPGDRVLQLAPASFDASVRDLLGPLAWGGTVALVGAGELLDPDRLLGRIARERVSALPSVVPSLLSAMVAGAGTSTTPVACSSVRWVLTSGESLRLATCERAATVFPRATLVNQYGPTESTLTASVQPVEAGRWPGRRSVPAGRPVATRRFYLVDRAQRPVVAGSTGEVLIGGSGLARGYQGRPGATAEVFLPDPWSDRPGGRLYRTGDLARFGHDGSLEFLGRLDDQVKIRGVRVEPGEVAAVLAEHPGVAEAAVLARPRRRAEAGGPELVAFTTAEGAPVASAELREHLRERLPPHLVPARFVALDAMLRTATGKVDRRALLERSRGPGAVEENRGPGPRDTLELGLVRAWERLLGRRGIGVRDDFFDLGGHSLLAVRLMAEVRDAFGVEVPLASLFQGANVERLAARIRDRRDAAPKALVEVRPGARSEPGEPPIYWVHPEGGGVLCYLELAARLPEGTPVYGLQSPGQDTGGEILDSVEGMAEAYLAEIRQVQPEGPYRLAGWSFGGLVAYEMAHRLRALGEEVEPVVLVDTRLSDDDEPEALDEDREVTRLLTAYLGRELPLTELDLEGLDVDAKLERVVAMARDADLLPASFGADEARRFFDVIRANRRARRTYRPPATDLRVSLLVANEHPAEARRSRIEAWTDLAGEVVSREVPGTHSSMIREPFVAELVAALDEIRTAASALEPTGVRRERRTEHGGLKGVFR